MRFVGRSVLMLVLAIAGCKTSETATAPTPSGGSASAVAASESAVIRVVADDKGYTPSSVTVQRGRPVTLEFIRTSNDTCATEVSFPELGINKPLPLNSPVDVPVPTDATRTYAFACGMGMFKGRLVVQ